MKLAEKILKKSKGEESALDENMNSHSNINVKMGEHEISMNVGFSVYKCYMQHGQPQREDDVEMQAKITAMFKTDMDAFMKSISDKLKAMKSL